MITTRSEYRYVTIPNGIVVDGDIMPQRDVLPPAQAVGIRAPKCLRGVDCAFLNECRGERYVVATDTVAYPPFAMSEFLNGSDMERTVPRGYLWSYLVRFMTQLPEVGIYQGISISSSYLGQAFNSSVDPNDLTASSLQFLSGMPLRGNEVRKIYRDYTKLRTLDVGNQGWSTSSWSWLYDKNGYGMGGNPGDYVIYHKNATNLKGSNYEWMSGDETWRVSGTTFERPLNAPARTALADAAAMVVAIQIKTDYTNTSGNNYTWNDTIVSEAQLSQTGIHLSYQSPITIAAANLRTTHNANVPGWQSLAEGTACSVTQTFVTLRAAATLGPHTDISGIGWYWTP